MNFQAVPAFTGKAVDNANIGGLSDVNGRYLKFVDGSFLVAGTYLDTANTTWQTIYNTLSGK